MEVPTLTRNPYLQNLADNGGMRIPGSRSPPRRKKTPMATMGNADGHPGHTSRRRTPRLRRTLQRKYRPHPGGRPAAKTHRTDGTGTGTVPQGGIRPRRLPPRKYLLCRRTRGFLLHRQRPDTKVPTVQPQGSRHKHGINGILSPGKQWTPLHHPGMEQPPRVIPE